MAAVFLVHSCFIVYKNLLPQFINSLQPSEGCVINLKLPQQGSAYTGSFTMFILIESCANDTRLMEKPHTRRYTYQTSWL